MLTLLCLLIINVVHFPSVLLHKETEKIRVELYRKSIYCNEEILHIVQLSEFVPKSQDFVDMKLKKLPRTILSNFKKVKAADNDKKKNRELQKFIRDNFEREPNLSEFCTWKEFPEFSEIEENISDENYRDFYSDINEQWAEFAVRVPENYRDEPESTYHSIIYVPNCYMKKDESDNMPTLLQAYWILRGMLTNQMFDQVEGMLRNYAYLIDKFNFVPYTNRVYALDRAQYPLFALMVEDYVNRVENPQFLLDMLPVLEKEYDWWSLKRKVDITIEGNLHQLFRYAPASTRARPEVYKHDYNLAEDLTEDKAKKRFYSALRGLNESCFGFSSRFLRHTKYTNPFLNLKLSNTIPVELNSVLQRYANLLGRWYANVDDQKAEKYSNEALRIKSDIRAVLWNPSKKMWFDYDNDNGKPIEVFYATNLMPLFTFSYYDDDDIAENAVQYLLNEGLIKADNFPRHVLLPITTQNGWLWDFPFGSLFLTAFVIEGLRETEDKRAVEVASNLAQSLIKVVYNGYNTYGSLLERYNVLPNSKEANEYLQKNKGKISPASIGCVITMLRWYGKVANHADYQSILTSDYFSAQDLVYAPSPKLMDMSNVDSESEEIMPTETTEIDDVTEVEREAKRQKTQ